jgi:hypothetical protein
MNGDTYAMHHLSAVFCLIFRNLRCQDIVDREQMPFIVGTVSLIDGDGGEKETDLKSGFSVKGNYPSIDVLFAIMGLGHILAKNSGLLLGGGASENMGKGGP